MIHAGDGETRGRWRGPAGLRRTRTGRGAAGPDRVRRRQGGDPAGSKAERPDQWNGGLGAPGVSVHGGLLLRSGAWKQRRGDGHGGATAWGRPAAAWCSSGVEELRPREGSSDRRSGQQRGSVQMRCVGGGRAWGGPDLGFAGRGRWRETRAEVAHGGRLHPAQMAAGANGGAPSGGSGLGRRGMRGGGGRRLAAR